MESSNTLFKIVEIPEKLCLFIKLISVPTYLKVIDNTGVKQVKCLKILKMKYGLIGTTIVVVIKKAKVNKKFKVGKIFRAVLIRTKKEIYYIDGTYQKFTDNCAVLLNPDKIPFSNKAKGPIPLRFKDKKKYRSLKKITEKHNFFI